MDRALKERIVGAAILAVFIVLVVPVFLDGPAEESPVVSESVSLPGQNTQQRKRQTIVLKRDREEPVPATQSVSAESEKITAKLPAAAPQETQKKQEPAAAPRVVQLEEKPPEKVIASPAKQAPPAPAVAKTETAANDSGMWAVQLGSFSKKENADRLAADLRGKGYAAFLSQVNKSGTPLHRVRIGPQKDRDGAETIAARLAKDGVKSQVVPHP
ncbi:MAG: hypothetical protein HKN35_03020 [Woeseia sp.]|nr:SPOR domain-containing protein [Woeseia sp.]MBT8095902.1 SPOR domain-containing protein [Woeseia sp.]NNE59840.1 hypothetical protein [Woeseia sp.]NNL54266.1 hypothetical protein [Woeseia sp.]